MDPKYAIGLLGPDADLDTGVKNRLKFAQKMMKMT